MDQQPAVHVSVAVIKGNSVLLVREHKASHRGLWNLPGGHVHIGESPFDAACRELIEETGIDIPPEWLVGIYTGSSALAFVFGATYNGQPYDAGDEVQEVRFVPLEELRTWANETFVGPIMRRMIFADIEHNRRFPLELFNTEPGSR